MKRTEHTSVLTQEVLHYLDSTGNKVYLDVTFGAGGHTRALLESGPDIHVIACDWDEQALERFGQPLQQEFGDRLRLIWGNFALLYKLLKKHKIGPVDGILADFGTSQVQIAERPGLSLYKDAPLDMRMSPSYQQKTAAHIVNSATERELADLFFTYGQERWSKAVARAIVADRVKKPFETTGQLTRLIERVIPRDQKSKTHRATRIFQALRIYVNDELAHIHAFLPAALKALKPGGRLVCISFHSLEDSIVKQFFKQEELMGKIDILTKKAVKPTDQEVLENRASRSARLRAAHKR